MASIQNKFIKNLKTGNVVQTNSPQRYPQLPQQQNNGYVSFKDEDETNNILSQQNQDRGTQLGVLKKFQIPAKSPSQQNSKRPSVTSINNKPQTPFLPKASEQVQQVAQNLKQKLSFDEEDHADGLTKLRQNIEKVETILDAVKQVKQQDQDKAPRQTIQISQIYNSYIVNDEGIKMHMELYFRYDKSSMELFVSKEDIPDDSVTEQRAFGEDRRYFPYRIQNALELNTMSWHYRYNPKNGQVIEKVELVAVLTMVKFQRYYPFELNVLSIQISADGTMQTGKLDLVPFIRADNSFDINYNVFQRKTSLYKLKNPNKHLHCKMFARDVPVSADESTQNGVQTQLFTSMTFQSPWFENFFKFIIFTTLLMFLLIYSDRMDVASLLQVNITLILTDVAVLFVLPDTNNEFTVTEQILSLQGIFMTIVTILSAESTISTEDFLIFLVTAYSICQFAYIFYAYVQFKSLVSQIDHSFSQDKNINARQGNSSYLQKLSITDII